MTKRLPRVLREFTRTDVERQRERAFAAEARRQYRALTERAADPASNEAQVMQWIEDVTEIDGRTACGEVT